MGGKLFLHSWRQASISKSLFRIPGSNNVSGHFVSAFVYNCSFVSAERTIFANVCSVANPSDVVTSLRSWYYHVFVGSSHSVYVIPSVLLSIMRRGGITYDESLVSCSHLVCLLYAQWRAKNLDSRKLNETIAPKHATLPANLAGLPRHGQKWKLL